MTHEIVGGLSSIPDAQQIATDHRPEQLVSFAEVVVDVPNIPIDTLPSIINTEEFTAVTEHSGSLKDAIQRFKDNPDTPLPRCLRNLGFSSVDQLIQRAEGSDDPIKRAPTIKELREAKKHEAEKQATHTPTTEKPKITKTIVHTEPHETNSLKAQTRDQVVQRAEQRPAKTMQPKEKVAAAKPGILKPPEPIIRSPLATLQAMHAEQLAKATSEDTPQPRVTQEFPKPQAKPAAEQASVRPEVTTVIPTETVSEPAPVQINGQADVVPKPTYTEEKVLEITEVVPLTDTVIEPQAILFSEQEIAIPKTPGSETAPELASSDTPDMFDEEAPMDLASLFAELGIEDLLPEAPQLENNAVPDFLDHFVVETDVPAALTDRAQPTGQETGIGTGSELPGSTEIAPIPADNPPAEITAYIETLEPVQAATARATLKLLTELEQASHESGTEDDRETAALHEELVIKLLQSRGLEQEEQIVREYMQRLLTPETVPEPTDTMPLPVDELADQGTHEHKTGTLMLLLRRPVATIKQKTAQYARIGNYALAASRG